MIIEKRMEVGHFGKSEKFDFLFAVCKVFRFWEKPIKKCIMWAGMKQNQELLYVAKKQIEWNLL